MQVPEVSVHDIGELWLTCPLCIKLYWVRFNKVSDCVVNSLFALLLPVRLQGAWWRLAIVWVPLLIWYRPPGFLYYWCSLFRVIELLFLYCNQCFAVCLHDWIYLHVFLLSWRGVEDVADLLCLGIHHHGECHLGLSVDVTERSFLAAHVRILALNWRANVYLCLLSIRCPRPNWLVIKWVLLSLYHLLHLTAFGLWRDFRLAFAFGTSARELVIAVCIWPSNSWINWIAGLDLAFLLLLLLLWTIIFLYLVHYFSLALFIRRLHSLTLWFRLALEEFRWLNVLCLHLDIRERALISGAHLLRCDK